MEPLEVDKFLIGEDEVTEESVIALHVGEAICVVESTPHLSYPKLFILQPISHSFPGSCSGSRQSWKL